MVEKEKIEQIQAEAKAIMDNFYAAMQSVDVDTDEFGVKRDAQTRDPQPNESQEVFREKMLKNAPNKDMEYIIAEKKTW